MEVFHIMPHGDNIISQVHIMTKDGELIILPDHLFKVFHINFKNDPREVEDIFADIYPLKYSKESLILFYHLALYQSNEDRSFYLSDIEYKSEILLETLEFCHTYGKSLNYIFSKALNDIFSCIFIHYYFNHLNVTDCERIFKLNLPKKTFETNKLLEYMLNLIYQEGSKYKFRTDLCHYIDNYEKLMVIFLYDITNIFSYDDKLEKLTNILYEKYRSNNNENVFYLRYFSVMYLFPNPYLIYIRSKNNRNSVENDKFKKYLINLEDQRCLPLPNMSKFISAADEMIPQDMKNVINLFGNDDSLFPNKKNYRRGRR